MTGGKFVIRWERHEKYKLAVTLDQAPDMFGTTDPARIKAQLLGDDARMRRFEQHRNPDGEGTLSVTVNWEE